MLIDMPLEELRQYRGCSPRPADFDSYWDESLAEMNAVDPAIEIKPSNFNAPGAKCSDLYFTGVGGSRIHALLLEPLQAAANHPAVVEFHGYTGNAGTWVSKLAYVNAGFTIAALDCRGQGGYSEDLTPVHGTTIHGHIVRGAQDPDPRKLLFRSVFLDTAQLVKIVKSLSGVDPDRVGVFGGSQGGGLTLACAGLADVNRACPRFPFLSDYRRVWEMDLAVNAYAEIKTFFRFFDPTHAREDAFFERLGYIDVQNLMSRVKCKVLMQTGLMDTVCPPSTQFAAYNKITSEKSVTIYYDFGHEGLTGADDETYQFMMEMA